jgi:energy-coupling factor transport system ATP-binding protein
MVEHRISFVAPYCSHVLVLDQGTLIDHGTRDNVFMDGRDVIGVHGLETPPEVHICRHTGKKLTFDEAELTEHVRSWHASLSGIALQAEEATEKRSPGSGEPVVEVEHVTFGYAKSQAVLKDMSLTVHCGEVVALMGANGTGKSTLLSLIAGLMKPENGSVKVNGYRSENLGAKQRASALGFLIQNPDLMLFCDTVYDELSFGPRHVKRIRKRADDEIEKILDFLNLLPQREQPPFALSMGQRLRAALGAVLSLKPRILLLDEPTTGQNEENIRRLMDTLAGLDHIDAIIFCTHDFETAIEHADRIVVLSNGAVAADGGPAEIFDDLERLHSAGLQPPLVTRMAHSLGLPPHLRLPHELSKALQSQSLSLSSRSAGR